jgi:PAS domain S-box-containing protein
MDRNAGPCCMAALQGEQVISTDVATETRWIEQGWCALALSHGLRSIWSTPIVSSAQRALGTFAIYFTHPNSPSNEHLAVIERFTHVAAVAIERSHAEDALRESEKRYERVMLASEAGLWDWDVVNDKYYVSPQMLAMSGIPLGTNIHCREDFVQRTALYPEDREKYQRVVRELLAGDGTRLTVELRQLVNGETRWFNVASMCSRDAEGKALRWTGSATDITDRKRAENALRLSEERYALAMEASEEGHFDWNVQSDEVFTSEHLKQVLDLPVDVEHRTRGELMAAHIPFHPDDRGRSRR